MNQLKYFLRMAFAAPFMPLLYRQANHVIENMPDFPPPMDTYKKADVDGFHILSLGESSIASIGVNTNSHGLTGFLADMIESAQQRATTYEIVAKSGYTAAKVRAELMPNIQSKAADLILIGLGANDSFQITQPKKWKIELEAILNQLRAQFGTTPIVFINMPPVTEFPAFTRLLKFFVNRQLSLLRSELEKLIDKNVNTYFIAHQLTAKGFIDKYQLNRSIIKDFYSDGVHPSQITYHLWAKEIFEFITKQDLVAKRDF